MCFNYLTRGRCPLGPLLLLERQKSTFKNDWGKFCSIVPNFFSFPSLLLMSGMCLLLRMNCKTKRPLLETKSFLPMLEALVKGSTSDKAPEKIQNHSLRSMCSIAVQQLLPLLLLLGSGRYLKQLVI